jgi:hypothetical protein
MTDLRQAAQQALEALQYGKPNKAITILREALEQPQQEQMRMPKAGDKVICLEDESIGTIVSLTAGGSPDIAFNDGSRGTYFLREFAELFGYVTPPQQQAEPSKWRDMVVVTLVREGINKHKARELADHFAAQPEQEPVKLHEPVISAWSLREVYFDEDGEPLMHRSPPAAQRPWVGLTDEEVAIASAEFDTRLKLAFHSGMYKAQIILRKKNDSTY